MVAMSTLMYEILLTRIFSVTMWYHFAFMVISIAMFGLTLGAILVFLCGRFFTDERTGIHLALSALLFSVSIVVTFTVQLHLPFISPTGRPLTLGLLGNWLFGYFMVSTPFIFSGVCVCLALTRFPRKLSKLYASDLGGAAIGCLLIIVALEVSDGPTAVLFVAFLASGGALFFALAQPKKTVELASLVAFVTLAVVVVGHAWLVREGEGLLTLKYVKGAIEPPSIYEKWNSFSRVKIFGDPNVPTRPFGWGLSTKHPGKGIQQLWLNIDAHSATVLTKFDGDTKPLAYLKYDVTNIAHWIRSDADVLVIGAGGGRDILTSLVFDQKSVFAIEMNPAIVNALNNKFGEFTGHLDRDPRVRFAVDEARSHIARTDEKFDIIQISLIDTWAATAAGAYVLTESSLYTLEGWKIFLDHLKPGGILAVSRGSVAENYRVASLARAALVSRGVPNPKNNIMVVRQGTICTTLVSPSPYSKRDIQTIKDTAGTMGFQVLFSPTGNSDPAYSQIIRGGESLAAFEKDHLINLEPPTDDSPFFFHMVRISDLYRFWRMGDKLGMLWNASAVRVLAVLILVVTILSVVFILMPLLSASGQQAGVRSIPFMIFFGGIGLGFMFVEISQLQRFNIFLGHPTYSLSVVLFTLLLSCGAGSYLTWSMNTTDSFRPVALRLSILLLALGVFGLLTPVAVQALQKLSTPLRIFAAVVMIAPLGLFMGMAFPMGMSVAASRQPGLSPWFWGINGATSVCGSVLALGVALFCGISTAFWVGTGCYVVSLAALYWAFSTSRGSDEPASAEV